MNVEAAAPLAHPSWPRGHGAIQWPVGALLDTFLRWRLGRLKFDGQLGEAAHRNTGEILDTFLLGASGSFTDASSASFRAVEADVPWTRRPFFWEGHSFGAAARASCAWSQKNTTARYHAPGFRFMFFTGLGFWNAIASHYAVPRVSLDAQAWTDTPDFAASQPLVAGGASFGAVVLAGELKRTTLDRLERDAVATSRAEWRRGLLLGAGRALWFLHMNDFQRLGEALDVHAAADADAIAEGLGVAMTYTQLGRPLDLLDGLERIPTRYRARARAGSTACLAAASADDARIGDFIAALPDPLPTWHRQGSTALAAAGRGPGFFDRFVLALRDLH